MSPPATPPAVPKAPAEVAGGQAQPVPALPLPCHCWTGLTLRQAQPCCRGSPASDACSRGVTKPWFDPSSLTLNMSIVWKEGSACRLAPTAMVPQHRIACPGCALLAYQPLAAPHSCFSGGLQHVSDNAAEALLDRAPPGDALPPSGRQARTTVRTCPLSGCPLLAAELPENPPGQQPDPALPPCCLQACPSAQRPPTATPAPAQAGCYQQPGCPAPVCRSMLHRQAP